MAKWWIGYKGATAWEGQLGPIWFRVVHLNGKYWRWKPWRRFSVGIDKEWPYYD